MSADQRDEIIERQACDLRKAREETAALGHAMALRVAELKAACRRVTRLEAKLIAAQEELEDAKEALSQFYGVVRPIDTLWSCPRCAMPRLDRLGPPHGYDANGGPVGDGE